MQKIKTKNKVMEKVLGGAVKMRPKWWFWLGTSLGFFGLVALSVVAIYTFNLMAFLGRVNSFAGLYGLSSLPWWLVVAGIATTVAGLTLLKQYDFSYKKNFGVIAIVVLLSFGLAGLFVDKLGVNEKATRGKMGRMMYGVMSESLVNSTPTRSGSSELEKALVGAIEDEYKARATYRAVIEKFGEVRPFTNIVRSEEKHIASLITLLNKYGFGVPEDKTVADISGVGSVNEACQVGYEAEVANADLYQKTLIPNVVDYVDVVAVFENLSNASFNNHLKAFARCK